MLIILLVILLIFCFSGGAWGYRNDNPSFGHGGVGLGFILLVILLILLFTGRL